MDCKFTWKISSKVDVLVDTINQCKKELTTLCFGQNGRARILTCDVYASKKVIELLLTSDVCTPVQDVKVSEHHHLSTLVADFTIFKLHYLPVMDDESIKVVAAFDVDDGCGEKTWFGSVELIS